MDPKVLRKLLTHGHGGSKVDEEAFDDGFPPPAGCRNRPPDWISPEQELAAAKKIGKKIGTEGFIEIWMIYRRKNGRKAVHRGPTRPWARVAPWPRHLAAWGPWGAPRQPLPALSGLPRFAKKIVLNPQGFLTSVDMDFLKSQKHAENSNWLWALN